MSNDKNPGTVDAGNYSRAMTTHPADAHPSSGPPPGRPRPGWRAPGIAGTASLGAPAGIGLLHPLFGEIIGGAEGGVALTVIAVALFGSKVLSERAFRLLRWFGNRPEPPPPSG